MDRCHEVKFNRDYCHPLLTSGWHNLRKQLSILGNAQMMISYHGNNIFQVVVGQQITSSELIPPYHSRSTVVGQTIYFDHCIDNKNNLVSAIFFLLINFFLLTISLFFIKITQFIFSILSPDFPSKHATIHQPKSK
jgi:hypothetical protein